MLWSWIFGRTFDFAKCFGGRCRPVGLPRSGWPAGAGPELLGDVFRPLPGIGCWPTVLLIDGSVGLRGDPWRIHGRAAELLGCGGQCVVEFDAEAIGICANWIHLESARQVGLWLRWAWVGLDSAAMLAREVGSDGPEPI